MRQIRKIVGEQDIAAKKFGFTKEELAPIAEFLNSKKALHIEKLYNEYNGTAAFAVASLLAVLALFTLGVKTYVEWKTSRQLELAQQATVTSQSEI